MAFRTEWIHEPYILGTTFDGQIAVSDVKMALLEYLGALQQQKDLYFIMDFTDAARVPVQLMQLPILVQIINHGNTRWVLLVKPEDPTSYMTNFLARDNLKTLRDMDTAVAFIKGMIRLDLGINIDGEETEENE